MRSSARLLLVFATALMHVFVQPGPAAQACSCAGLAKPDIAFDGTFLGRGGMSTMGAMWRFKVVRAELGTAPGAEVEIDLSVPERVHGGMTSGSSCDLSASAPTVDRTYRVTAYAGDPNGMRTFFANQCGGSLELAGATDVVSSGKGSASSDSDAVLVGGGAVVAALLLARFLAAVRRRMNSV